MARLIDADAITKNTIVDFVGENGGFISHGDVLWLISKQPTIEAEPVNHGKVIERLEDGKFKRCCSCCDEDLTVATMWTVIQYCPYCGARMDGE